MYYSNQIIYKSEEMEKQMRITNKSMDFLKFHNADQITFKSSKCGRERFDIVYKKFDTFDINKNLKQKE